MNPRRLLALAFAAALLLRSMPLVAQVRTGVPRIGILSSGTTPSGTDPDPDKGVLRGLRELGYVEGQTVRIERRYAEGSPDRLALMAEKLSQLPGVLRAQVHHPKPSFPPVAEKVAKARAIVPPVAMNPAQMILHAQLAVRPNRADHPHSGQPSHGVAPRLQT